MSRKLIHTESTDDQRVTVKVYKDSGTQEYIARVFARGECLRDADYYTDNKDDAIGTARDMLKRTHDSM